MTYFSSLNLCINSYESKTLSSKESYWKFFPLFLSNFKVFETKSGITFAYTDFITTFMCSNYEIKLKLFFLINLSIMSEFIEKVIHEKENEIK